MALSVGDRLGPYEILSLLGAGGMGQVWRARDTRLGREVAIKVSAERFSDRFEREARAVAALNHPNICTLYDVGPNYLVMELVEGSTLAERIAKGPLPLDETLKIAEQIAEALEAAHEKGIIHRDLKPANVKVTPEDKVKVLDFGLAKASEEPGTVNPQDSPTLTMRQTQLGMIVGTASYMAPEQASGKPVDKRADIWSFGAVLWEMITGKRLFDGETVSHTLADVLREPINFDGLPRQTPLSVRELLRRCLDRNVKDRLRDIGEARFQLGQRERAATLAAAEVPERSPFSKGRLRKFLLAALPSTAVAAAAAGLALHAWMFTPTYLDVSAYRSTPLALSISATGSQPDPDWAPDGKTFAYVGEDASGRNQLFLQSLTSPKSSQLTMEPWDADYPVYSPDGTRIYYLGNQGAPREIWSISTAGGAPQRLFPALGGTKFLDGLAVSPDGKALVFVKVESGGRPLMLLWISSPPGAPAQRYPGSPASVNYGRAHLRFSPDGSRLLAMLYDGHYELRVLSWPPATGAAASGLRPFPQSRDWDGNSSADWLLDGRHLLVTEGDPLRATSRFMIADVETGNITAISPASGTYSDPAVNRRDGRILIDQLRSDEDAVEIPLDGSAPRDLVATSRRELYPAWSPSGEEFIYVTDRRGEEEIWLSSRKEGWHRPLVTQKDLPATAAPRRFVAPVWSPDGRRIAYTAGGIWISPAAGGPATPISPRGIAVADPTWSPDGVWIAFRVNDGDSRFLAKQKVGANLPPVRIADAGGGFRPAWSPDGKWITIQFADGFGVVSPDGAQKKTIFKGDPGVGSACGWSRDGSTLFLAYLKGNNTILSAFDARSWAERKISDLGAIRFSYFSIYSALLSESPDRKSLASSIWRRDSDVSMIEGLNPPPDLWHRLFWRPSR